RFRGVLSFGWGTIRRFSNNASEMKRKAARDYEDLLQCIIAVIEGLLDDPHNEVVLKLLYLLCQWHALAKLRIHHKPSLQMLEETTVELASQFRKFKTDTCDKVDTFELPREARARAQRAGAGAGAGAGANKQPSDIVATTASSGFNKNLFNFCTYKYHVLADYPSMIRRYGTTDSYTSEVVSWQASFRQRLHRLTHLQ
ncbi:hypothetical protein FA15DRAFT_551370, partial [Coprinopsis marcescibilis]